MTRISYALWSMPVVWPLTLSQVLGWVSILKLTVLEDYLEFHSGTGTVEKLCVWSFTCLALCAQVRGLHLLFWDKRVGGANSAKFSENSRICSDIWHPKLLGISSSELGSAPYWVGDISRTCSPSGNVSEVIGSFIGCLDAPELEFSTFCSDILWRNPLMQIEKFNFIPYPTLRSTRRLWTCRNFWSIENRLRNKKLMKYRLNHFCFRNWNCLRKRFQSPKLKQGSVVFIS